MQIDVLICEFCGKNQLEVELMHKGPISCICNECVALCVRIQRDQGLIRATDDLSPEATEACAAQTEIAITALRAAARAIAPSFSGHHESVKFVIKRLQNLTQSFLDACQTNDALTAERDVLKVESAMLQRRYDDCSAYISEQWSA